MVLAAHIYDSLDSARLNFVTVNGYKTRYYDDGSGDPFVLFHGGQYGSLYSLDSWSLALPRLAERFRVIAVDKPGQGYTDNPSSADLYTFEELMAHSICFIEAVVGGPAHLAGHSRGGLLIAAIALARPALVKSLVIVSSATLSPEDPIHPGGMLYQEAARLTPPGPPTLSSVRIEPDLQAFNREQVTDDFVARLLETATQPKFQEAQAAMAGEAGPIWAASLAANKAKTLAEIAERGLRVPTMHVWGANDKSWYTPLGLRLFDIIREKTPKSCAHVVNQSGHYVFREQTDEFVRMCELWCLGAAAS